MTMINKNGVTINDGDTVKLFDAEGTGFVDCRYATSNPALVWVKWTTGPHIGYYLSPIADLEKIAESDTRRDKVVIIGDKTYGTLIIDSDRKRAYFRPRPDQYLSDMELEDILKFVRITESDMVSDA